MRPHHHNHFREPEPPETRELLEQLLINLLAGLDLADAADEAGIDTTSWPDDAATQITRAASFADAGVLTLDRGVWPELSDGAAYALTIGVARLPHPTPPAAVTGRQRRHAHLDPHDLAHIDREGDCS